MGVEAWGGGTKGGGGQQCGKTTHEAVKSEVNELWTEQR